MKRSDWLKNKINHMQDKIKSNIPGFVLNSIPEVKIKSLRIQNFKAYENCCFDFSDGDSIKPFVCFIGTNGTGKSTALNVIQMLFQRYDGYEQSRLLARMSKCVRHTSDNLYGTHEVDDFLIEADISSSLGDYTVCLNKLGFLEDHPEQIKRLLYRLCYFARFDKELDQFQLLRDKWDDFKRLFESVAGYEIEEIEDIFSSSSDPVEADMLDKYVLGFVVKKPFETIHHKECSNGEKKIIKSFSTLLNLEITPKIILIDDIAMHVALGKHIALIEAMQSCYPDSQIISTTHSYRMMKNLKMQSKVYDLGLLHASPLLKAEPWRLRIIDEIDDSLYKLEGLDVDSKQNLKNIGKKLRNASIMEINDLTKYKMSVSNFLKEVSDLYIIGVLSCRNSKQITKNFNN